jgi:hypothetical protein
VILDITCRGVFGGEFGSIDADRALFRDSPEPSGARESITQWRYEMAMPPAGSPKVSLKGNLFTLSKPGCQNLIV